MPRDENYKYHFRNEQIPEFIEIPIFSPMYTWEPPMGDLDVEVFLSQIEDEVFKKFNFL